MERSAIVIVLNAAESARDERSNDPGTKARDIKAMLSTGNFKLRVENADR
jgi:hypothetical protein